MTAPFHPNALVESPHIGAGTRVWAFAHVLPGARIGRDCNICDHVFIENDVVLGDRVTVKCGVQLWDGLWVGNDVFIGPNATFTNDKSPRSKAYQLEVQRTRIDDGASIGANATILPGLTIGRRAMIGAGTVVTHSVPPRAIVVGNPGRIVGYAQTKRHTQPSTLDQEPESPSATPTAVSGVVVHNLKLVRDLRGDLAVGNFPDEIPFTPRRFFLVFDVPSKDVRGEHAHRTCHQFMVCAKGSVCIAADDGRNSAEVLLDRPSLGLHVPPMIWGVQFKYSPDAVLLVFASHAYDADDYIRDYEVFLEMRADSAT